MDHIICYNKESGFKSFETIIIYSKAKSSAPPGFKCWTTTLQQPKEIQCSADE